MVQTNNEFRETWSSLHPSLVRMCWFKPWWYANLSAGSFKPLPVVRVLKASANSVTLCLPSFKDRSCSDQTCAEKAKRSGHKKLCGPLLETQGRLFAVAQVSASSLSRLINWVILLHSVIWNPCTGRDHLSTHPDKRWAGKQTECATAVTGVISVVVSWDSLLIILGSCWCCFPIRGPLATKACCQLHTCWISAVSKV